ncbi:MAG: cation transporter, partial [Providencia sp.]|nr:cation transporter [Providencia sp.]
MSNKIILKLQGLSCMHCVGSVTKALEARGDVTNLNVTIDYATLESDANVADIINTITEAGYEAEVASVPDIELQLSGLNCMKCAGKTQKTLEEVEGVAAAVVSTTQAKVYGSADAQTLIAAVEQAGFKAQLPQSDEVTLSLSGLSCMKCAAKTQQALEAVDGVTSAKVDTTSAVV